AMTFVEKGAAFSWISERDGWRHLYFASRDGSTLRRVIDGAFDVIRVEQIDEKAGRIYFLASPANPTQQYLFSAPLAAGGGPGRLTPADQPGTHDYSISEDGAFAQHTYSAFGKTPRVDLVSLPDHKVIRTLSANEKLASATKRLARTPAEFFRVDIGRG